MGERKKKRGWKTEGKRESSPFPQVVPDDGFVEPLALVKELCNVFWGVLEKIILQKKLDPLLKKRECTLVSFNNPDGWVGDISIFQKQPLYRL